MAQRSANQEYESSSVEKTFTTAIYNPALLDKKDLVRGFVARHDVLKSLLQDLQDIATEGHPPHQLILGQRGAGKTTMLHRLAVAIDEESGISRRWLPLLFPEEQYNVGNLETFLINVSEALIDALNRRFGDTTAIKALDEQITHIRKDGSAATALQLLRSEAQRLGLRLLLMVDNIDIILDRLKEPELAELSRILLEEHWMALIAASSRPVHALHEQNSAFYSGFRIRQLSGLTEEEMRQMVLRLAEESGDENVMEIVQTQPSRLRALRVLTGGNPRSVSLLYRVLSKGPAGDIERDLKQFLDIYTPIYKDRLHELAKQGQRVIDAMALHWDPITTGDLAVLLPDMEVNQISAQLARLDDFGLVEKVPWFGENKTAYQIAERSFNVWYLMRNNRRSRQRLVWLVKFLQAWFQDNADYDSFARRYAKSDPETIGAAIFVEHASAIAQAVKDPAVKHDLMHNSVKALSESPVDLPNEWELHWEHTNHLNTLGQRILAFEFEGIDSSSIWDLLGGSPLYSLDEKKQIVDRLEQDGTVYARELFLLLNAQRIRLEQASFKRYGEVDALHRQLREGKFKSVYDPIVYASAGSEDAPFFPIVALTSRSSSWCMHKSMSPEEFNTAEQSWKGLLRYFEDEANRSGRLREDAFHRQCLSRTTAGLATLLFERARRYEESRNLLEAGLDVDPDSTALLSALGRLLRDYLDRPEDAERIFDRVKQLEPDNAVSWSAHAEALARMGRDNEAERSFRKALDIDPTSSYGWGSWANFLSDTRLDFEGAKKAYEQALQINPENRYLLTQLGDLFQYRLGQFQEAQGAYERSIEWESHAPAWNGLGMLWGTHLNKTKDAEEAFQTAIALDPTEGLYHDNLGDLYASQVGRSADALTAYHRATELDDQWKSSFLRTGLSWYRTGKLQEALLAFGDAVTLSPTDSDAWLATIQVLVDLGRYTDAEQTVREALERFPDLVQLRFALGLILSVGFERNVEAEVEYRNAIAIDQTFAPAWVNLINLQISYLHRYDAAESTIQEWIGGNGEIAEAWRILADLLANQLKRPDESISAYRRALDIEPGNARTWAVLGDVLLIDIGDYAEAENAYLKSIELNPGDVVTWTNYGILLDRMNRTEEALEKLRHAAALDPKDESDPLARLAEVLLKKKRLVEALEVGFRSAIEDRDGKSRKEILLTAIRSLADSEQLQIASDALSRYRDIYSDDPSGQFVGVGLSFLLNDPQGALASLRVIAAKENSEPDIWAFAKGVKGGHTSLLVSLLDELNISDRWRPLYVALQAVINGSKQYLNRIAPEVRESSALEILKILAPDLPDGLEDQQVRRKQRKTKRWTK